MGGLVLGALAIIGIETAAAGKHASRITRSAVIAVRTVVPTDAAVLLMGPSAGCTVLAVVILLWLGRRLAAGPRRIALRPPILALIDQRNRLARDRSHRISYRSGGLYGP